MFVVETFDAEAPEAVYRRWEFPTEAAAKLHEQELSARVECGLRIVAQK